MLAIRTWSVGPVRVLAGQVRVACRAGPLVVADPHRGRHSGDPGRGKRLVEQFVQRRCGRLVQRDGATRGGRRRRTRCGRRARRCRGNRRHRARRNRSRRGRGRAGRLLATGAGGQNRPQAQDSAGPQCLTSADTSASRLKSPEFCAEYPIRIPLPSVIEVSACITADPPARGPSRICVEGRTDGELEPPRRPARRSRPARIARMFDSGWDFGLDDTAVVCRRPRRRPAGDPGRGRNRQDPDADRAGRQPGRPRSRHRSGSCC